MEIDKNIKKVLDFFEEKNIKYEEIFFHREVFSVEDVNSLEKEIPGRGIKTLFLRDRKGKRFYLVSVWDKKENVSLEYLADRLGEKRLNFATESNLNNILFVKPGSITPTALINDKDGVVKFVLDRDLFNADLVAMHPNLNTATIILERGNFLKMLENSTSDYIVVDIK